jgi:hypothetical protein
MDRPARQPPQPLTGPAGEELPHDVAKVLSAFFKDGRLVTIPSKERKRLVVLRYLRDRVFTEDRPYPEAEVNQRLALFNRDVAALRRYMVDAALVTRSAGEYRRADDAADAP